MILYHGSFIVVDHPDLAHSRGNVDFWKEFYVTPIYEQAAKWCSRFKHRGKNAIVSQYTFDEGAYKDLKVLVFDAYTEDWLDFILSCRREQDNSNYNLVIGGVTNDKVFNTVELFFDGLIDKVEAIKRLQYEKPNLQMAFRTDKALSYLRFEGSEKLWMQIRFFCRKNMLVW